MSSKRRAETPGYIMRVLLAVDRLGNALTGGDDRETITERARRWDSWFARNILRHFARHPHERIARQPRGPRHAHPSAGNGRGWRNRVVLSPPPGPDHAAHPTDPL